MYIHLHVYTGRELGYLTPRENKKSGPVLIQN